MFILSIVEPVDEFINYEGDNYEDPNILAYWTDWPNDIAFDQRYWAILNLSTPLIRHIKLKKMRKTYDQ